MVDVRPVKFELSATDGVTAVVNKADAALSKLEITYGTLTRVAGGFAAGLSVAALAATAKHAIDLGDELNKMSQRVGVSVESLSTLRYVADLSGVGMQDLEGLLVKLNKKLGEASVGSAEAAGFLKQFGVDVAGVRDGTVKTDEALKQIADRFAKAPDGINKTAAATELFGKQAGKMIPFLNQGRDGIETLESEARKLGVQMSTETARRAEEFNDQLRALKFASEGAAMSIVGSMLPALVQITQSMRDGAVEGGKLLGIYRGMQTAITGGDQYKNDKALFDLTEKKWELEQKIARSKNSPAVGFLKAELASVEAQLTTTMAYRGELEKTAAAEVQAAKAREAAKAGGTQITLPGSGGGAGRPAGPSEYDRLIASIREKIGVQALEAQSDEKLTEGQRLSAKVMVDLRDNKLKLTDAQKRSITGSLEELIMAERMNDAVERRKKFEADYLEKQRDMLEAAQKQVFAMAEHNQMLRLTNEEIGLTGTQLDELHAKRVEDAAAIARQTLEQSRNFQTSEADIELMERRIKLLDEQVRLTREGGQQKRFAEASKKMEDEARRASENIERSLTDALMRGFESGKDAATNFKDTLSNMFRTLILRPIIEAQVKPFADAANQLIGRAGGGGVLGSLFDSLRGGAYAGSDPVIGLPGFATGGSFQVGGSGGTDSQLVRFRASPDETVTITRPGDNAGAAPNVKIEVINKGQPLSAQPQAPRWDGRQWVIGVLVDALRSDNNLRQSLAGALSAPRG